MVTGLGEADSGRDCLPGAPWGEMKIGVVCAQCWECTQCHCYSKTVKFMLISYFVKLQENHPSGWRVWAG